MKIKLTTILPVSAALAVTAFIIFTGCTKENGTGPDACTDLEIASVSSENPQSKAVIDGTDFPKDKGSIGLFLFKEKEAMNPYGESDYRNVSYSWNSDKSKWTADPSIKVGSTPGHLYGYFPYNKDNTDIKSIPIASSLNGDDVMYASKQSNPITDKTAASTSIVMNHALARIALTVKQENYTGEAKLTNIKFTNAAGTAENAEVKISASGNLNAVDGTISATKSDVSLDVPEASQSITSDGTTYDCLLVPSASDDTRQTVTLTLTIDNDAKSVTLSGDNGVKIKSGVKSTITITLSDTGLAVSSVSITDWGEGGGSTGKLGGDV